MARNLDDILDALPAERRAVVEHHAAELATLKDLRQAMQKTQVDLAATLHIGQDSVSRLEKRSDMLLSTLRSYIVRLWEENLRSWRVFQIVRLLQLSALLMLKAILEFEFWILYYERKSNSRKKLCICSSDNSSLYETL